jgi:uncharacterized protein (DUF697 family)
MEARANVAVSLVMNFFSQYWRGSALSCQQLMPAILAVGGGLQATMGITNVLLVDLFPGNGGAITASVSHAITTDSFAAYH